MVANLQRRGLESVNGLLIVVGILVVLACGASGSLALLYRARRLRAREQAFGVSTPYLQHLGAGLGALSGMVVGALASYYIALNQQADPIEWIGRFSYVLIAWAAGGHLLNLIHSGILLRAEERGWERPADPDTQTLGQRRRQVLNELRQRHRHYIDLKTRDDALVDELIGFLGNPLASVRRDLGRIPLYGYLGTVCGILLMAEELSQIDEATQTFKVLGSMARGLVLAFKTTLVGLLTYLPLRKAVDYMLERVGLLEEHWTQLRDDGEVGP
jgi:hypothetical protein